VAIGFALFGFGWQASTVLHSTISSWVITRCVPVPSAKRSARSHLSAGCCRSRRGPVYKNERFFDTQGFARWNFDASVCSVLFGFLLISFAHLPDTSSEEATDASPVRWQTSRSLAGGIPPLSRRPMLRSLARSFGPLRRPAGRVRSLASSSHPRPQQGQGRPPVGSNGSDGSIRIGGYSAALPRSTSDTSDKGQFQHRRHYPSRHDHHLPAGHPGRRVHPFLAVRPSTSIQFCLPAHVSPPTRSTTCGRISGGNFANATIRWPRAPTAHYYFRAALTTTRGASF